MAKKKKTSHFTKKRKGNKNVKSAKEKLAAKGKRKKGAGHAKAPGEVYMGGASWR